MKKILVIAAALVAFPLAAEAQSVSRTVLWDPAANATGYEIERSVNAGAAWTVDVVGILPAACVGTPARCSAVVAAPAVGYTLYRVVSVNGTVRSTKADGGVFVCAGVATCPPSVSNVGTP